MEIKFLFLLLVCPFSHSPKSQLTAMKPRKLMVLTALCRRCGRLCLRQLWVALFPLGERVAAMHSVKCLNSCSPERRRPKQRVIVARRASTARRGPISETHQKKRFQEILSPDSESTGSKTPRMKAKLKGHGRKRKKSLGEGRRRVGHSLGHKLCRWNQAGMAQRVARWGCTRGARVRVPCRDSCLACACLSL